MTRPTALRMRHVLAACLIAGVVSPAHASPDDEPLSAREPAAVVPVARAVQAAQSARTALKRQATPRSAPEAPAPAEPADPKESLFDRVQDRAGEMIVSAMQFIGVPYARGGDSAESGFDCSGFTRHVFRTALGLVLPRRADEQAQAPGFAAVAREALQPGDLVFFNTLRRGFSHVGIYIGDHRFIHAPSRGKDVRTDDMRHAYWSARFDGARRAGLFAAVPQSGD